MNLLDIHLSSETRDDDTVKVFKFCALKLFRFSELENLLC